MKSGVYEEVSSYLASDGGSLEGARATFPDLPLDTLLAIQCQIQTRHLRLTHHKLRHPDLVEQYVSRYMRGEDILSIAEAFGLNPCLLARILLEHLLGLTRQQITECLKDPEHLPKKRVWDVSANLQESNRTLAMEGINPETHGEPPCVSLPRLRNDLYKCMDHDGTNSPYVELIRRVTGREYEEYLCNQIQQLGVPFRTESTLRDAGFSKTPDVKLEIPIGVMGRVVNWIDSKATFGDEFSHKNQAELQFQRYVNRFGPGMVIYWFGFVEELDNHPDVLMLDRFPLKHEIYCLSSVPLHPRTCEAQDK